MFSLDDDLIIDTHEVNWLLLLNLLVLFLLVILLYYSSIFAFKNGEEEMDCSKEGCNERLKSNNSNHSITRVCSQHFKVNQEETNINNNATTCRIRSTNVNKREEAVIQKTECSPRELTQQRISCYSYDPCHWLGRVGRNFLQCLGLDSTYQDSSAMQQITEPTGIDTGRSDRTTKPTSSAEGGQIQSHPS